MSDSELDADIPAAPHTVVHHFATTAFATISGSLTLAVGAFFAINAYTTAMFCLQPADVSPFAASYDSQRVIVMVVYFGLWTLVWRRLLGLTEIDAFVIFCSWDAMEAAFLLGVHFRDATATARPANWWLALMCGVLLALRMPRAANTTVRSSCLAGLAVASAGGAALVSHTDTALLVCLDDTPLAELIDGCLWALVTAAVLAVAEGHQRRLAWRLESGRHHAVAVRTDGIVSEHYARVHQRVFGADVDRSAWAERMAPGRSWVLTTSHGHMAAHRRGDEVNVWVAGVESDARGRGEFKALVRTLISRECVGSWRTTLTMTTRPAKFEAMHAILARCARRCDAEGDAQAGKARYRVAGWALLLALHRKLLLRSASVAMALAAVFVAMRAR